MLQKTTFIICWLLCVLCCAAQGKTDQLIHEELPLLTGVYEKLHAAPELSGHEEKTSAFMAAQLRSFGYEVTEGVGKFTGRPWKGYGVVAVLKNGNGPVVLVRTEMDALPLTEKTGLPFASTVTTKNDNGEPTGVMHACGHDIHMTSFLGVAKILAVIKNKWKGTVLLVAQPAEEAGPGGSGAEALLNDSLYTRFPKPDYILGLHQTPVLMAGQVGIIPGYSNAVSGGGEIIIHGVAAHPSRPQDSKDPIVLAAQLVLALQTITSRETDPLEPATLTIGAIHGGVAENAIPDEVRLRLSFRAFDQQVFDHMLQSIRRITNGLAVAAGIPDNKLPVLNIKQGYPANYNDPALANRISAVFKKELGAEHVETVKPLLTGEDFSYYSADKKIPSLFFTVGSADPAKFKESQRTGIPLPGNHSPLMVPSADPTIRTAVKAMTVAALELLKVN